MLGDARYLPLKNNSINCVITSPPYWSLRKYNIPDLIWDGVDGCEHEWVDSTYVRNNDKTAGRIQRGNKGSVGRDEPIQNAFCPKCSAWRGQLGLEPTIDLYLKHLLQCFDEVKRVLKPTGSLWVNIGDSYSGSGCGTNDYRTEASKSIQGIGKNVNLYKTGGLAQKIKDIPPKSLCLIPERFAIEMVNRGWILRNKIIWAKPNCMPASVKDRFTVDFEPVFFFVKSKKYWFETQYEPHIALGKPRQIGARGANIGYQQAREGHLVSGYPQGHNMRTVWTIPTQPYSEAHYATFPEELVERCIKAGCPRSGIVLDPLAGSGTVMAVAEKLSRIGIGFDLAYQDLQNKRILNNQKVIFA